MLVVSYHGPHELGTKVHRPETCYAVDGFTVGAATRESLSFPGGAAVNAVSFDARRDARREAVLYWTRVGTMFPQSLLEQRLFIAEQGGRGILADGLLVRVSALQGGASPSDVAVRVFAADLIAAAPALGRALMLGHS